MRKQKTIQKTEKPKMTILKIETLKKDSSEKQQSGEGQF